MERLLQRIAAFVAAMLLGGELPAQLIPLNTESTGCHFPIVNIPTNERHAERQSGPGFKAGWCSDRTEIHKVDKVRVGSELLVAQNRFSFDRGNCWMGWRSWKQHKINTLPERSAMMAKRLQLILSLKRAKLLFDDISFDFCDEVLRKLLWSKIGLGAEVDIRIAGHLVF